MSASLELVSAIASGNAVEIESSFGAAIAEKIANRLDDMRLSVAQSMFGEQAQTQEIVEFTKEEWEALSEEEQAQYELIEEEQLNELSDDTLHNYIRKSEASRENAHTKAQRAVKDIPSSSTKRKAELERDLKNNVNTMVKRETGMSRAYDKLYYKK